MANRYRGEASLDTPNGPVTLRLTLDALARLEQALAVNTLGALIDTLVGGDLSASQVRAVLLEALVAGGDVDRSQGETLLAGIGRPLILRQAYVELMRATFAP